LNDPENLEPDRRHDLSLVVLSAIGAIWLGMALLVALHVLPMALLGRWFGASLEETRIGFSPSLLRLRLAGAPMTIGAVLLSGSARFAEPDAAQPNRRTLQALGLPPFVLVCLVGCLTLLAVGYAIHGIGVAAQVDSTLATVWSLITSPSETAPRVTSTIARAVQGQSALQTFGWAAVVLGVLNLLPIPPLNGGQLLLEPTRRMSFPPALLHGAQIIGTILILLCVAMALWIGYGVAKVLLGQL
jgi:membrane-associated protease RseP (regulator of RpoE activity)